MSTYDGRHHDDETQLCWECELEDNIRRGQAINRILWFVATIVALGIIALTFATASHT